MPQATRKGPRVVITKRSVSIDHPAPSLVDSPEVEQVMRTGGGKPKAAPTNKEVIDRAKSLRKELSGLLAEDILVVREFLLTQIAPKALAFNNGVGDANDIISATLGVDPQWGPLLSHAEGNLLVALKSKVTIFVKRYLGLDEEESAMYMARLSAQEFGGNDAINRLLHEMLKVSPVQGSKEGSQPPVSGLQASSGRGVNSRRKPRPTPTKGRS